VKKKIIFTRGTTESINLVAQSFEVESKEGDEIIISAMGTPFQHVPGS